MKITQLIAFLPWLFTQIPAYSSGPWSMQSCVRHALEHRHDLKIQTWNIKSQKTNLTEAYTAFLPSLSIFDSIVPTVKPRLEYTGRIHSLSRSAR